MIQVVCPTCESEEVVFDTEKSAAFGCLDCGKKFELYQAHWRQSDGKSSANPSKRNS